ncbi:hypothetical protein ACTG4Q_20970 [Bradyrhizobium denitrificans]
MKRIVILIALLLAGCEEGGSDMPLPRKVCTQITNRYSCGRGGVCEECGNWEVGCPKPLKLMQIPTGSYDKGEPRLACRLKGENDGLNDTPAPEMASPLR